VTDCESCSCIGTLEYHDRSCTHNRQQQRTGVSASCALTTVSRSTSTPCDANRNRPLVSCDCTRNATHEDLRPRKHPQMHRGEQLRMPPVFRNDVQRFGTANGANSNDAEEHRLTRSSNSPIVGLLRLGCICGRADSTAQREVGSCRSALTLRTPRTTPAGRVSDERPLRGNE
jgi:hypothetical protein